MGHSSCRGLSIHSGGSLIPGFSSGQQMNCMPLLSSYNCFNVLYIENTNDIEIENQDVQKPEVSLTSALMVDFGVKTHHPKWEKLLPKKFIIAAIEENPTSLKLKVEIETMDTAEKKSLHLLWIVEQPESLLINTMPKTIASTLSSSLNQYLCTTLMALLMKLAL